MGGRADLPRPWRSPPPPTGRPRPARRAPGRSVTRSWARGCEALWERNYSVYGRRKLTKAAREGRPRHRPGPGRPADASQRAPRRQPSHASASPPTPTRPRSAPRISCKRDFTATRPNEKWVADFTYCSTWSGIVYVAFIVDVFSRRIVGWKAARSMTAPLVVDALNMAAWARRGVDIDGRDLPLAMPASQYTSIAYTDRLDDIGAAPSIGTVGDSFDNAMAESVIGLFKTELHRNPAALADQRRPLARPRRPRDRHLRVGVVVQRRALPRRARRPHPSRGRRRLLPSPLSARRGMRNQPNEHTPDPGRFTMAPRIPRGVQRATSHPWRSSCTASVKPPVRSPA